MSAPRVPNVPPGPASMEFASGFPQDEWASATVAPANAATLVHHSVRSRPETRYSGLVDDWSNNAEAVFAAGPGREKLRSSANAAATRKPETANDRTNEVKRMQSSWARATAPEEHFDR